MFFLTNISALSSGIQAFLYRDSAIHCGNPLYQRLPSKTRSNQMKYSCVHKKSTRNPAKVHALNK